MDKDAVQKSNFTNSGDRPNEMTLTCHCVNVKCKIEIMPPEPEKSAWPFWLAFCKYLKIPKITSLDFKDKKD